MTPRYSKIGDADPANTALMVKAGQGIALATIVPTALLILVAIWINKRIK